MFRFTIRDVLWLTVVIGMGLAWFVDHRQSKRLADLALTVAMAMQAEGWTLDLTNDHGPFFKTPDGKRVWKPYRFEGQVGGMNAEYLPN